VRPTVVTWVTLIAMAAVAAIGAIDAAVGGSWDQVALFGLLLATTVTLLARTTVRRPLLPVRADLFRWLARRAAVTGERTEHLADRAISAYRAGLVDDRPAAHDRDCRP
jgi:hypothetical protein